MTGGVFTFRATQYPGRIDTNLSGALEAFNDFILGIQGGVISHRACHREKPGIRLLLLGEGYLERRLFWLFF